MSLVTPYRGDGTERPEEIPLPPDSMPLFYGTRLRKRWRYVALWSRDLSLCAGTVEVGPVPQEFWAVWDRKGKRLWEKTRLSSNHVEVSADRVRVNDGDVSIDVRLDEGPGLEVVTPSGPAYTWTRKKGGIRARGKVQAGDVTLPVNALALVDENAGYHPRHTRWVWSGGAGLDAYGNTVAWSVISGLSDAPANRDRTLWINGVPYEVGPVRFAGDLSRVTFVDGGELLFKEEAVRAREDDLFLLRSSYRQPFGTFTGTLPNGIRLFEAHGVMERHDALW